MQFLGKHLHRENNAESFGKRLEMAVSARKTITIWSILILSAVIAYGWGRQQGTAYRLQKRSIASEPVLILDNPNNIEIPTSHSE